MNLSHIDAEEQDFEGTEPDDWAWTDRLAASMAYDYRRWRKSPDTRNAAERAHNLLRVAAIATEWATQVELAARREAEDEARYAALRGGGGADQAQGDQERAVRTT